ncbi:hypothetical protein HYU40_03705 [Candidatus Woesearchaeota archaeon]|nr:hypothetical protein [Candidatus Woesearchaeota archaeon]
MPARVQKMKKGQTFSTDAIVAVVMFVIAVIMLYYLSGPATTNKQSEKLQSEAEKLPATLSSQQNLSSIFIQGSRIDEQKLSEAINLNYDNLKSLLGVGSDFCIYLEDENGNIVPMEGKVGIGSPLANFSGKGCNETLQ